MSRGSTVVSLFLTMGFLVPARFVNAALVQCGTIRPCNFCDLLVLGRNIIDFIWWNLSLPLGVCLAVFAGFLFIVSGDNSAMRNRAKGALAAVVVGTFIMFGSWLVIATIINVFARTSALPWQWNAPQCG